jgi:hypothetical protein
MSVSFESAVASLKTMFPEWDDETLSTLLVANNYHVERTVETILGMCGDPSIPPAPETSVSNIPMPPPTPAMAPNPAQRLEIFD